MKPIIFTSFMVAFMCFPFLCTMAQPINSVESQEGLNSLIGKYFSSTHYVGSTSNWTELNRRSVFYDHNNNMMEYVQENNNSGTWEKSLKYSFEYNFDNKLHSSKCYYWLGEDWNLNSTDIYNYDTENRLSDIIYAKKKMGVLTYDRRIIFEYNQDDNLEKQTEQIWNSTEWVNTFRTVTDYNSQGQVVLVLNEVWNSSEWKYTDKTEYSFDLVNRLCEKIEYYYQNDSWIYSRMLNCKYDKWGRMIESQYSLWTGIAWIPDYKLIYLYQKDNIVKSTRVMKWSVETLEYTDYSLTEKTFDHLDREITKLVTKMNFGKLENYCLSKYSYDEVLGLTSYEKQKWENGNWSNDVKLQYNFNVLGIDNEKHINDISAASPNPFDENVTISFTLGNESSVVLKVIDSQGRTIQELENNLLGGGSHSYSYSGDNLPSGIYYYQLQIDGQIMTKPIIKIK